MTTPSLIPTTMRAAVYERYGPPDVVTVRDLPTPRPARGEVLIRVHASTVNSGDWRARSLQMPKGFGALGRLVFGITRPRQPILGSEFSGVIASVGAGVTRFREGDAVFGFPGAAMGSHAEYLRMAEDAMLAAKPEDLTHEEAAGLSFGGMTALGFLRRANLVAGERILINGASGAVGIAATQLARHFGAQVTAVTSGGNAALLKSMGAEHVIDYTKEDFTANGARYDVILDAAGTAPFERARQSLTVNGRFLPVLGSFGDLLSAPWVGLTSRRRIVSGSMRSSRDDMLRIQRLARTGAYRAVIDRCYPLDEIVEAHRYVDTGRKRGSVVVNISPCVQSAARPAA